MEMGDSCGLNISRLYPQTPWIQLHSTTTRPLTAKKVCPEGDSPPIYMAVAVHPLPGCPCLLGRAQGATWLGQGGVGVSCWVSVYMFIFPDYKREISFHTQLYMCDLQRGPSLSCGGESA